MAKDATTRDINNPTVSSERVKIIISDQDDSILFGNAAKLLLDESIMVVDFKFSDSTNTKLEKHGA